MPLPTEVQYVDPRNLKQCLLNIQLYGGQDADAELKNAIAELGIKTPLLLAADGETIVSGHRRRLVAITLGYKLVPVVIDPALKTEDDIHEALVLLNRQRERTAEQKAREYIVLKEITQRRYGTQLASPVPGPEDTGLPPEVLAEATRLKVAPAAVVAAQTVGSSVSTMERAVKVVDKIDKLKEQGKPEKAEELSKQLNKSVRTAAASVSPRARPSKPFSNGSPRTGVAGCKAILRDVEALGGDISKLFQKADMAVPGKEAHAKRCMDALSVLNRLVQLWSDDL